MSAPLHNHIISAMHDLTLTETSDPFLPCWQEHVEWITGISMGACI